MAERSKPRKGGKKNGGSKRLTREEYDRLVRGADDVFFGGLDEPKSEQKPFLEKSASEPPKHEDDVGEVVPAWS